MNVYGQERGRALGPREVACEPQQERERGGMACSGRLQGQDVLGAAHVTGELGCHEEGHQEVGWELQSQDSRSIIHTSKTTENNSRGKGGATCEPRQKASERMGEHLDLCEQIEGPTRWQQASVWKGECSGSSRPPSCLRSRRTLKYTNG